MISLKETKCLISIIITSQPCCNTIVDKSYKQISCLAIASSIGITGKNSKCKEKMYTSLTIYED